MARPGRFFNLERWSRLLPSVAEAQGIVACTLAFWAWNALAREMVDVAAGVFFLAFFYIGTLSGRILLERLRLDRDLAEFPTVFLVGFFFVSSALLVLSLILPYGIAADALILALGVLGARLGMGPPEAEAARGTMRAWPGLAAVLISLWAATFWSIDAIRPIAMSHGMVVFKPWSDTFMHSCYLRMFRDARGAGALENVLLPGLPATIYHYTTFIVPALLAAVTDTPCYLALTSLLIPLGIALTGLAAFALVRSWWGPGAGLAATVALLLLPDASVYGVKNPLLGFHWLEQVAPGGPYGVALLAIAWRLLFEACRLGRPTLLGASYLAAGLVLGYKAHLFVSNAFLLWTAPSLLYPGLKPSRRLAWLLLAVATFLAVGSLARRVPSAPLLRLDGSGTKTYAEKLAFNLDDGPIKQSLSVTTATPWCEALGKGVVHLMLGTFGLFGPAALVLLIPMLRRPADAEPPPPRDPTASRRIAVAIGLFPLVVIVNYLVMSLGLAPDEGNVNGSDELLHRPLVWAYFVVAAWVGGAFYALVGPRLLRFGVARTLLPATVAGLLAVPFFLGKDVQVGPGWGKEVTNTSMPIGLYRCALFVRENGRPGERVLDSGRDPTLAFSALCERPEYVIDYWDPHKTPVLAGRLDEVKALERTADLRELEAEAAKRRIAWYVLRPGALVNWPGVFLARPAFVAGEYRVYRLAKPNEMPPATAR